MNNYLDPLASPEEQKQSMSALDMALTGGALLGGGIVTKKLYDKTKKGLGGLSEAAKDYGASIKTTGPGRTAARVVQTIIETPNNIRKAGAKERAFEQAVKEQSALYKLAENEQFADLVKGAAQGVNLRDINIQPASVAELLTKVATQAKNPMNLYSPNLKHLGDADTQILRDLMKGKSEGDIAAGLMFANELKKRSGLFNADSISDWTPAYSIYDALLQNINKV